MVVKVVWSTSSWEESSYIGNPFSESMEKCISFCGYKTAHSKRLLWTKSASRTEVNEENHGHFYVTFRGKKIHSCRHQCHFFKSINSCSKKEYLKTDLLLDWMPGVNKTCGRPFSSWETDWWNSTYTKENALSTIVLYPANWTWTTRLLDIF